MTRFQTRTLLLITVSVLCGVSPVLSGIPQTINYQGYLKDSAGMPVTAPTSIRFSLYSSNPPRNNPVWRETKSISPSSGIYSTQLGSATPITAPFDVSYWLGVKVTSDAEMPLQPLSSVPYAQRALVAENISSSGQLITSVPTGTSPLLIVSTTLVPNLNADMVDGKHADDLVATATASLQPVIAGIQSQVTGLTSLLPDSANWDIGMMHQTGMVDTPEVAINNVGQTVAAWRRNPDAGYLNPYVIESKNYAPSTGWDSVYHEFASTSSCGFQQPSIDSDGNSMIVFMCGVSGAEALMYSRRPTAASWSVPQQINPVATTALRNIKTSIDPAGNVFAIWQQAASSCVQTWAIRYTNGSGWGTAQRLDSAGCNYAQSNPQIAVDSTGNAIATWQQYDGNTYSIWYSRYVAGSGWNAASALTTGGNTYFNKLLMDGAGNALVFWTQSDGAWYRRYDAISGWASAQSFYPGTTAPQIAMSSNGSSIAVWPEHDGSKWNVMFRRFVPGSGWGTAERLNITLDNSHMFTTDDLRIAMNSSGNAIVIGTRYNSVSSDVWSMQYRPISGWGPIQMVEADVTYAGQPMNLVMNDGGTAIAAWIQQVLIGGNYVSQIMTSHLNSTQSLALPHVSGANTTTLTAPSGSENRTIQLPDVSGKIITTGNLTDITMVGTVYQGEWKGWRVGIPYGGTDAVTAEGARANLQVPGLSTANIFTGTQYIGTGANTSKGLVIQGASGQSANLQEWMNSAGAATASVSNTGVFSGNGSGLSNLNMLSVSGTLAVVNGGTGGSTAVAARNSLQVPGLFTGNFFTGPQMFSPNFPFENVVVARGLAGQTANLQEWQNNSGTAVASVSPIGIFTGNGSGLTNVAAANGVVTTGSYANPAWLTSIVGSKVSGNISGNAANVTGTVAIANGGTGSATQSFVDLSSTQNSIGGNKTFTGALAAAQITSTGNIDLPVTSATAGQITQGGRRLIHTYGTDNVFVGIDSGNLAITGSSNTASGSLALTNTTTGDNNTANGFGTLHYNTSGSFNTAYGDRALVNNTTANNNTAIGALALYTQSYNNGGASWDSYNTAVGYQTLYSNQPTSTTNGNYNAALGSYALTANTTGYNNVAIGADSLKNNTSGISNSAVGYSALFWNTTGNRNTAVGRDAGLAVSTGSDITLLGYGTNVSSGTLANATAVGSGATVNASNKVRIGNSSVTVIEGQVGWSYPSDIRLKEDVREISKGLDLIAALRPVEYRLKNGNGRTDFGFIAQQIESLLGTDYNVLGVGEDADRTLSLRYTDLIAPMVKAMQEQQDEIELLRSENKALTLRLERLEKLIHAR